MLRKLLLSVLAAMVPLAGPLASGAAHAATTAACTGGVSVSQFTFNPSTVPPTGNSALTLVLQNCGSQSVQGSTTWYGQYVGQGCPVIDPANPYPFTIAAGGTYTLTNTYGNPGLTGCQPTSLRISANVNVNGAGTVTTATATLQFTAACTGSTIAVDQFSFNPAAVTPSQSSTLTLVLHNCTGQTAAGSSDWYPALTWSGTGLPPGCPHLDPVAFTYSMAPGATSTTTFGLGDPIAGCLATGLQVTANVYENGVTGAVATAAANLVIIQPAPGGCHVTYSPSNWQGGFTANITIANNGTPAINGWTLTFAFPGDQKITNAWNATVRQSGTSVTAANLGYNASIPPGGSQSFGFQGTWAANDTSPTAFDVNGVPCS
jgi:hypothetical protein